MIRSDKFLISQRPYAVDLSSLKMRTNEPEEYAPGKWTRRSHSFQIDAVWFRRKGGVTTAHIGGLHSRLSGETPADAVETLERFTDGRYGGDCAGRWDGSGYWGAQDLDEMQRHLAILRPMLENFPAVPPGFDGWWRF